jgi:hypothetical protein
MSRFDRLAEQVAVMLDVDEAIIDGEVIAVDETGRPILLIFSGANRCPTMWPLTSSGSTVLTCDLCRSTS